jgi:hypothetical protein
MPPTIPDEKERQLPFIVEIRIHHEVLIMINNYAIL